MARGGNNDNTGATIKGMWVGYQHWSVYMHVFMCIHVIIQYMSICMYSGKQGCLCKRVFSCVSVCVGCAPIVAFESCDECQSNVRGKKGLERRRTQT